MKHRRGLLILVAFVGAVIGEVFLLDADAPIDFYRAGPNNSLTVIAESEPSFWARVTAVEETAQSVTVHVRTLRAPLPSTGGDRELTVTLKAPLGTRVVVDGSSGVTVSAVPLVAGPTFPSGNVSDSSPPASPTPATASSSMVASSVRPSTAPEVAPTPDLATVLPIASPDPGDEQTARDLLGTFQDALTSHHWHLAWNMLAPETRRDWRYDDFAANESGFMQSAGTAYDVTEFTHDPARIRLWVVPDNYPNSPIIIQTADFDRSFVARVWYRALRDNNAGWNEYLLGPDQGGTWHVWWLR